MKVKNRVDHVRRNLLFGIPAFAMSPLGVSHATVAQPVADALPEAERVISPAAFRQAKDAMLDQTIEITRRALARDAVNEALAWQGEFPQSALFRAMEIPILPAHLDETKYDVTDLRRRYPVQIGAAGPANGARRHARVIGSLDKVRDPQFRQDGYLAEHYGNCFYWNAADTIVTTEHLAQTFPESAKAMRRDALDISVAMLGPQFAARAGEQIIHDDALVTDDDIHGNLVCIVGRDPDALADMDGAKVYPGVAVKMTPAFVVGVLSEILHGRRKDMPQLEYERYIARARARMINAYMMVLPAGEARAYPDNDDELPCQGMSASPVFGFIRGRYRLVGIFFLAMCLEDAERRRMVDVAFFHPVSAIRKIAADQKGYWTLR
jgi:hypothetical protein